MKKLLCLASLLVLCGCVSISEVKPGADALGAYKGTDLTTIIYKRPPFLATTWGSAALGPGGVAAMIGAGVNITGANHVPDPSLDVAAKVSAALAEKIKPASSRTLMDQEDGDPPPSTLPAMAGNKGLVFDIGTFNWSFAYFSLDWSHYRVIYGSVARLTDASTGKVIARVPCQYDTGDEKTPPTYDELVADNAALLKQKLATMGGLCTDHILKTLLAP